MGVYFCVIAILGVVVCDMKNAITIVASVREISSKTAKMKTEMEAARSLKE